MTDEELMAIAGSAGQIPTVEIPGDPRNNISVRQNNPGNLKFAGQEGALSGTRGFAIFKSPEEGLKALHRQIDTDKNRGLTLSQFGIKYAPPFENDTINWIKNVANMTGASPDTLLSNVPTTSLAKAVAKVESGAKVKINPDEELMAIAGSSLPDDELMKIAGGAAGVSETAPAKTSKQIDTQIQTAQPNAVQQEPAMIPRATAEAAAKASGVEVEPGLEQPTFLDPVNMLAGLGGVGKAAGLSAMAKAVPGMLGSEVVGGTAYDVLSADKDIPESVKLPLSLAAMVAGGTLTSRLGRFGEAAKLNITGGRNPLPDPELLKAELSAGISSGKTAQEALKDIAAKYETTVPDLITTTTKPIAAPTMGNIAVNDAMPNGMVPAKVTPVQTNGGLIDKYSKVLSEKDTSPSVLGKFSGETPVYGFERLEHQTGAKGLKEDIWFTYKDLQTAAKKEYDTIEKASRSVEEVLPKNAGRRIYNYAVGQQKGGAEILARMKETPVTELVGPEAAAYNEMRQGFDNLLGRWNEARVSIGKEPIDKVDNYFTFIRKYMEIVGKGGNPLTINPKYFRPLDINVPYEIQRAESNLPLMMDAFKVYRRYNKSVLDYIYQAPHTAEVRNLAQEIGTTAPNTANYLTNWADQVMGLSKMKNKLFEGGSTKPTTWLGKSVDWTANKLAGIKPIEEGLDRAADKFINNIGVSTLSGYARSAMIQPTSMVMATGEVGPINMVKGIKDSAFPSKWAYAKEHSSVLSTREFDVNIAESMDRMLSETKLGKLKAGAAEIGYAPLHYMDQQAAISTWWAAFRKGLSSGMEPGKELYRYADDVVIKTQGSASKGDLSRVQTHTLGKALTQFQTFVVNEANYLFNIIPGLKKNDLSFGQKLTKTTRVVAAGALANMVYEDVLGMPSPLPTPIRSGVKALTEGRGYKGAAAAGVGELSQLVPVLGGARYTGGSPLGPVAQFIGQGAAALKGEPSQVPLWTLPLRLRGVPGTVALERLSRVPGKLSLGEALFGKMQPEKPVGKPRKETMKHAVENESYLKDLFPDLDLGL